MINMKLIITILSAVWALNMLIPNLLFAQSNITYDAGSLIDVSTGADVCADAIIINGTYSGGGTICQGPLPVLISSFTFSVNANAVILSWITEAEMNNSGFDIERKEVKEIDIWEKINFVPGSGTTSGQRSYSFQDKKLNTGKYRYRLKQMDYNGNSEYFELGSDVIISAPMSFSMSQSYPNPSNPKSKIDYEIPFDGRVTIRVFDILGQEAAYIVDEFKKAGYYTSEFDGTNIASGIYFYRFFADTKGGRFSKTGKLVLVK